MNPDTDYEVYVKTMDAYQRGYTDALNAARDAVRHALGPMEPTDPGQRDVALAAIDALREGTGSTHRTVPPDA